MIDKHWHTSDMKWGWDIALALAVMLVVATCTACAPIDRRLNIEYGPCQETEPRGQCATEIK